MICYSDIMLRTIVDELPKPIFQGLDIGLINIPPTKDSRKHSGILSIISRLSMYSIIPDNRRVAATGFHLGLDYFLSLLNQFFLIQS